MDFTVSITNQDVEKEEPLKLVSPNNPDPPEIIFLSNIDLAVAFPVETVFFFEVTPDKSSSTLNISHRLEKAVAEVLLVPYYFMAGRLNFNHQTRRLELLCNNAGALFVSATSRLRLKDLGKLYLPNSTFHHFVHRPGLYKTLAETALLTIQAMLCKLILLPRLGENIVNQVLYNDRTCFRARIPPQIKYPHMEYVKLQDISSLASSFTAPNQLFPSPLVFSEKFTHKLFSFTPEMIATLKEKAMKRCSSFEAIAAHLWRARTKAIFTNPTEVSTVLFAVDIRSKTSPPLPNGFVGNAVITAFATSKVAELVEKPFCFCVEKMREAIERVTEEYVRSVIDWLEVYKGVPATCNGNFYVSAWSKLPFGELDFGFGKLAHGGPVASGNDEFALLLSEGKSVGNGGCINVWMGLERDKMKKFAAHIFEI
ncbi:hypothetical protein I3760_01G145600 [Carya illinoinensis]|nr:hypothetical protein I3760_01G145600 [Carya illinoinensis]